MKTPTQIFYRGYTIEPTTSGCPQGDYYPTDEGRNEDYEIFIQYVTLKK